MAAIRSSFKSKSFVYDFAVDTGAIAALPMGVFLPAGAQIYDFLVLPITPLASGGAATVDVGVVGRPIAIISNVGAGFSGTYADYNSPVAFINLPKIVLVEQSTPLAISLEIIVSIGGFVLTAGKFNCTVFYIEY